MQVSACSLERRVRVPKSGIEMVSIRRLVVGSQVPKSSQLPSYTTYIQARVQKLILMRCKSEKAHACALHTFCLYRYYIQQWEGCTYYIGYRSERGLNYIQVCKNTEDDIGIL